MKTILLFLKLTALASLVVAQAPKGPGEDKGMFRPVQPGDPSFQSRKREPCDNPYREINGVCTNRGSGFRKLWGSTNRPQFSHFDSKQLPPLPTDLPSARLISNKLFKQTEDVLDERRLSQIAVFLGQFIDHTLVASPASPHLHDEMPIPIPEGDRPPRDSGFNGSFPFTRSARVKVAENKNQEFPQNSLSSAMDLTNVYGPSKMRNSRVREGENGLMKIDTGGYMPLNDKFRNAPRIGSNFFLAGDHRCNEHPVLTSLHTLFLREHNKIAEEVRALMPNKGDFDWFGMARKINEAQWQKIVFEEWYPSITGRHLPEYRRFKRNVNPTVSLLFSTASFRIGHTMVSKEIEKRGKGNRALKNIPLMGAFFMNAAKFKDFGISCFLRGSLHARAQKVDTKVVDALRNGLFTNVNGESDNFDLVALNIQRGRDHEIPPYNIVREKFGLPLAKTFADITSDLDVQAQLEELYTTPDRVEAFPGLLAEDHAIGSSFGPLTLKIWEQEFTKLRDGDRFYFRNVKQMNPFSETIMQLPRMQAVFSNDSNIFRNLLMRNTNIEGSEMPKNMFFVDREIMG